VALEASPTCEYPPGFLWPNQVVLHAHSSTLRINMNCPRTPSGSSHASQLIAAALRTPTPSPPKEQRLSHITTYRTEKLSESSSARESPRPLRPVYNMYGLDYGTDTTSDTGSIQPTPSAGDKSQYERLFPLKLPFKTLWRPPIPAPDALMVRHCSGRCFIHCSQCSRMSSVL
jgi:hypothetical protein